MLENGKVTKIEYYFDKYLNIFKPKLANEEAQIAWIMGDVEYNGIDGNRIYVSSNGKIMHNNNTLSDDFNFNITGDNCMAIKNGGDDIQFEFAVENGKVTRIEKNEYGSRINYNPKFSSKEAQIAWLMGSVKYADGNGSLIYVDILNGNIDLKTSSNNNITLSSNFTFTADGNDFVTNEQNGASFRFVVEYSKVTKIVETTRTKTFEFLPQKTTEEIIAELMGETKYAYEYGPFVYTLLVNDKGKIVFRQPLRDDDIISDSYNFKADGDNYVAEDKANSSYIYRFEVKNGKVTKIVNTTPNASDEYLPVKNAEDDLAEMMGETKYVFELNDNIRLTITVNDDGNIVFIEPDGTFHIMSDECNFKADGNDYQAVIKEGSGNPFFFIVENGKVTKIERNSTMGMQEFLPKQETATGSRRAELDHVGAYNFKTIENGRIVIIKGGEKYDLSGAKIK